MCFLPHFPPLPPTVFDFFVMRFVDQRKREVSFSLPKGVVVVGHGLREKGLLS